MLRPGETRLNSGVFKCQKLNWYSSMRETEILKKGAATPVSIYYLKLDRPAKNIENCTEL